MYFIIWKLTSLQKGCRLALQTPFLSSANCSSGRKNSFLAFWPNTLSSSLQGIPNGKWVTRLMSCGVRFSINTLKFTVASAFSFSTGTLKTPPLSHRHDLEFYHKRSSNWQGDEVHHLRMFTQFSGIRGFLPDKPPWHSESALFYALSREGLLFYGFLLSTSG